MAFGTATFSKELLFRSISFSLSFLSGYRSFQKQLLLGRSTWSIKFFQMVILYFFQKTTWSRPFYKVVSFYLKRGVAAGHYFLQTYGLLLEDHLEASIPSCRKIYFTEQVQPTFQGLHGKDNFWQQLLTKNGYFFGGAILDIRYFKGSLFISLITNFFPLK